jgi:hypothetical protein
MKNNLNWSEIETLLNDNFISEDFSRYSSSAFVGVDFTKAINILRYILELEIGGHDKSTDALSALESYSNDLQNKSVLSGLVNSFEAFLKKLFKVIETTYVNHNSDKVPMLGWCYGNLFSKINIPRVEKSKFFETETINHVKYPKHDSDEFANCFLTDDTHFGESLHISYHLRNDRVHNDPKVTNRKAPELISHFILSYIYFVFTYYNELVTKISPENLEQTNQLTIRDLASLSGGAYDPDYKNEVDRSDLIQTIDNKLNDKLDILFIEGEQGIGKTTLLYQFIKKHSNNCLSYFIDGQDASTYSLKSIMKSFCNQINFILKSETLEESIGTVEYNDEVFLKNYLRSEIAQLIRRKKN